MSPKVFVVILNWNRKKITLECIRSLKGMDTRGFGLEIVIVDNGSSDGSIKKFEKIKDTKGIKFHLVKNKKNLGYAEGNNRGLNYSLKKGADFVMVLNNDTTVDKYIVRKFIAASKKFPKAGILCPKIYFAKNYEFHKNRYGKSDLGKVIWSAGGKIDWNNVYGVNRGVDEVDEGQYEKGEEVDFAPGTCLFINAKVLKETGLFDGKYFMYLEDVDFSVRIKRKGWKVVYVPESVVYHKVAQSSAIGGDLNDYFITRNRLRFGIMYAPIRAKIALLRESWRLLLSGRKWQRIGVFDFYLGRFGKGSWKNKGNDKKQ